MRKIRLSSYFNLKSNAPGVFKISAERGHNRTSISIEDFLTILPVQNSRILSTERGLMGMGWSNNEVFGYALDENVHSIDLFKGFNYDYYEKLESDINKINPNFHFVKKSSFRLNDYIEYFKEAVEGKTKSDLVASIGSLSEPLSVQEFFESFTCIDPTEAYYVLPYAKLKDSKILHCALKEGASLTPTYVLKASRKQMLLFVQEDKYYTVKFEDPNIYFKTFEKGEQKALVDYINLYFPEDERSPNPYDRLFNMIEIDQVEHLHVNHHVKTTAKRIADGLYFQDDFPELRKYFAEQYHVRARGKDELWEKGVDKIKDSGLRLDYPIFEEMNDSDLHFHSERNNEVLKKLNGTANERLDTLIKLRLLSKDGVILQTNEMDDYYGKTLNNGQNSRLYMIPDYGEMAKKSPDIDTLLKK